MPDDFPALVGDKHLALVDQVIMRLINARNGVGDPARSLDARALIQSVVQAAGGVNAACSTLRRHELKRYVMAESGMLDASPRTGRMRTRLGSRGKLAFALAFLVAIAVLGCKGRRPRMTDAGATINGTQAVNAACQRLRDTGFSAGCMTPATTATRTVLEFTASVPNIAWDRRGVIVFDASPDATPPEMVPGDYVSFHVTSPTTKLTIRAGSEQDGGTATPWASCLAEQVKTATGAPNAKREHAIAACAKKFPMEYAWFHAFHDEAKHIVDGGPHPGTCKLGYLCGNGCVDNGDTCCIEVGRPDRTCPRGGTCLPNATCTGGDPPPSRGGGEAHCPACTCGDGTCGCCGRGCCSHHGGIR